MDKILISKLKKGDLELLLTCPNSKIYIYGNKLIKKYFGSTDVAQEFNNQKLFYSLVKNQKLKVPKPIFFSKEDNFLVMKFIPDSETLVSFLRKNNLFFKNKKELLKIVVKLANELNLLYEKLEIYHPKKLENYDSKIYSSLKKNKKKIDFLFKKKPLEAKKQFIHGNLKGENILITNKNELYLIDFSYSYESSIYMDIGKLFESFFTTGFKHKNFFRYNFFFLPKLEKTFIKNFFKGNFDKTQLNYYRRLYKYYDLMNVKGFNSFVLRIIYKIKLNI